MAACLATEFFSPSPTLAASNQLRLLRDMGSVVPGGIGCQFSDEL
jgi:hypothetical protein